MAYQNGQLVSIGASEASTTRMFVPADLPHFCPVKTESGEPDALQNTVTFDAQKWRSALGAYFFTDCTASRDAQGHWGDYTVGAAAIS